MRAQVAPYLRGCLLRPHVGLRRHDGLRQLVLPATAGHAAAAYGVSAGPHRADPIATLAGHAGLGARGCIFQNEKRTPADALIVAFNRLIGWGAPFFIVVYSCLLCVLARLLPPSPGAQARSAAWNSTGVAACSPASFGKTVCVWDVVAPGKVATRTCPPSPPHSALFSTTAHHSSVLPPQRAALLCAGPPPFPG